jgi:nidogen (entactin)
LGYDDDVSQPDEKQLSDAEPRSCANGGTHKCHVNAECKDSSRGFCCHCRKHFIGNGYSCIKADAPLRITGTVTGKIGNEDVSSQLQSYVVLTDGRSYTALSPVTSSLGAKMQFLQAIGGTIGWLFSKPTDNINKNGYQVTIFSLYNLI